jgi:hypothetical protein
MGKVVFVVTRFVFETIEWILIKFGVGSLISFLKKGFVVRSTHEWHKMATELRFCAGYI